MKVTATDLDPSPLSLRVGMRMEYSDNGPIRFAILEIPLTLFTAEVRSELMVQFSKIAYERMDIEPLF